MFYGWLEQDNLLLANHFSMSARSGFTRFYNALANKIISDRTSYYIDGLMDSVLPKNLTYTKLRVRAPKFIAYIILLGKNSLSQYICGECRLSY